MNLDMVQNNIINLGFRVAINGDYSEYSMSGKTIDEFVDESGVDTGDSVNQVYDSSGEYYTNAQQSHIYTANGTASLQTSQQKFGTASLLLDGSGANVDTPASEDWDFGSGDFVVDFWWRPTNTTVPRGLICAGSATDFWEALWTPSGNLLIFQQKTGGVWGFNVSQGQSVSLNIWHHIAFVRDGNNVYFYYDGNRIKSADCTGDTFDGADGTLVIGNSKSGNNIGRGYFDEIRVSKGTNRGWTGATITVPTAPYTVDGNTKTLLHLDGDNGSTDIQDAVGSTEDMILVSEAFEADSDPSEFRLTIREEDIDSVTLNTDLMADVSRDDGTTWTQVTLSVENQFDANSRILTGGVSVIGQPSGKKLRWRIRTENTKELRIHAMARLWS